MPGAFDARLQELTDRRLSRCILVVVVEVQQPAQRFQRQLRGSRVIMCMCTGRCNRSQDVKTAEGGTKSDVVCMVGAILTQGNMQCRQRGKGQAATERQRERDVTVGRRMRLAKKQGALRWLGEAEQRQGQTGQMAVNGPVGGPCVVDVSCKVEGVGQAC